MKKIDQEMPPLEEYLAEVEREGDWRTSFGVPVSVGEPLPFLGIDLDGEGEDGEPGTKPRGEERKPPSRRCGPDVSDWFRNEMERHRKNLEQVRANFVPGVWIHWVWKKGLSIQYKSMEFNGDDCPSGCDETVWLCGHCVHRSELGNIILGFWVAYLGFTARVLAAGVNAIGSKKPGEGADDPTDAAAVGLGFAMGRKLRKDRGKAEVPVELKDEEAFCRFLNAGIPWNRAELEEYFNDAFENGKMWSEGWSAPFTHITAGYEECGQCPDAWKGKPHELPSPKPPM